MHCHLRLGLLLIVLVFGISCDNSQYKAKIAELESENTKLQSSYDEANEKLKKVLTENEELKRTAEFYFRAGNEAFDAGRWDDSIKNYNKLLRDFPNSNLGGNAMKNMKKAKNEKLLYYLVNFKFPSTRDEAQMEINKLNKMIANCESCKNLKEAKKKYGDLEKEITNWPISVKDIQSVKIRFADLKGKNILFQSGWIKADTYYNYNFSNEDYWRSFEFASSQPGHGVRERLNTYCRRGEDKCEELFQKATENNIHLENTVLSYPQFCRDESVIEIVRWQFGKQ